MAEVLAIQSHPENEGQIQVVLDFKASKLAFEDQELGALKGMTIDQSFIDRNRIQVGNQYSVYVSELTEGDCTPRIVSFNHSFE